MSSILNPADFLYSLSQHLFISLRREFDSTPRNLRHLTTTGLGITDRGAGYLIGMVGRSNIAKVAFLCLYFFFPFHSKLWVPGWVLWLLQNVYGVSHSLCGNKLHGGGRANRMGRCPKDLGVRMQDFAISKKRVGKRSQRDRTHGVRGGESETRNVASTGEAGPKRSRLRVRCTHNISPASIQMPPVKRIVRPEKRVTL